MLNEAALPFFEAHEARVYTILSDNGREFCGHSDHHPNEQHRREDALAQQPLTAAQSAACGLIIVNRALAPDGDSYDERPVALRAACR